MSEFKPIKTLDDLNNQDEDEMLEGYLSALRGNHDEPGSDKSRSFWHGWRNGMVDNGMMKNDDAQKELAGNLMSGYYKIRLH